MKIKSVTNRFTLELLKKEIRLQRNNAMFTLAVVLLGFIALVTITASGPEVMSFSADDIRAALYMTVLIPALVVILPLMVGSTAAASERALGVWAWQAALPVSWWRVIALKMIIVITAIAIIAGILPYLLQLVTPPEEHALSRIFRDTWPGWFGILCGAIGFYSGALARDDYHGLMLSVLPLAFILLWMWVADPFLMVAPFMVSPIYVEWALALRLLLIALLLAAFAGRLLKHHGQRRIKLIAVQAAIMIPVVVSLTLWNIVTERYPLLNQQNLYTPSTASSTQRPFTLRPHQIASAYSQADYESYGHYTTFVRFSSSFSMDPHMYVAGMAGREYQRQDELFPGRGSVFVVGPVSWHIKEFPNAEGEPRGFTRNLLWVWINHHMTAEAICGPLGITISKYMLPDSWFDGLRKSMGFVPVNSPYSALGVKQTELAAADNDQLVLMNQDYILWKNAKREIPSGYTPLQRKVISTAAAPAEVKGSMIGRSLSAGDISVPFVDDNKATVSAVLRQTAGRAEYTLAGWATGEVSFTSTDNEWTVSTLSRLLNSNHRTITVSSVTKSAKDSQRVTWQLPTFQSVNDGTAVSIDWRHNNLPILEDEGKQYTWFGYSKRGPVTWNNQPVDATFAVELGLMFLNLETGEKTYIPAPMPWPAEGSLKLQNSPIMQHQKYGFSPPGYIWHQHTGQLMMRSGDYLGYTTLRDGTWKDGLNIQYAKVPGYEEGIFLSDKEFIATDGAHLWGLYLPQLAPH